MRNTIWILFALAAASTAYAQSSGTLRAAIVDEQGRPVAGAQLHAAFGEAFDAQFRARQVDEDADFGADTFGRFAHGLRAGDLPGRVAMREVQADDVDARAQQRVEQAGGVGGRAEGGQDAGAAALRGVGHGKVFYHRRANRPWRCIRIRSCPASPNELKKISLSVHLRKSAWSPPDLRTVRIASG